MDNFQLQKWTRNYSLSNKLNGLLQQEEPEKTDFEICLWFYFYEGFTIYKLQVHKLLWLQTFGQFRQLLEIWRKLKSGCIAFLSREKLEFWTRSRFVRDQQHFLSDITGISRFREFEKVSVIDFQSVTVDQLINCHMCITKHARWRSIRFKMIQKLIKFITLAKNESLKKYFWDF